ncbi:hypothetical protein ANN_12079 [Periplaneta americana]|uniref:PH domain-containing protein n=1 Tax=Periplaneta americana TaxID=6978 RepID=A0ABQ8T6U0_PERAM|nr:hypothetical protein ANN_12079 [Periplaneta americana]
MSPEAEQVQLNGEKEAETREGGIAVSVSLSLPPHPTCCDWSRPATRKPSTKAVTPSERPAAREVHAPSHTLSAAEDSAGARSIQAAEEHLTPTSPSPASSALSTPRLSPKESAQTASLDRKKDRSRSKSPFRSFRWKKGTKSPTTGAGAHSDDEANLERAAGEVLNRNGGGVYCESEEYEICAEFESSAKRPSPGAEEDQFEGNLVRKHEWESTTKKASNRSWDKLYVVLRGSLLMFYKDQKSYKAAPDSYFKSENPVDLRGGSTKVADDYTKKKHVFRIKLANGAEYLFQARDDEEMNAWVQRVSVQCDLQGSAGPSRSQTLPASGERKDEPKRRSFFTLKKNVKCDTGVGVQLSSTGKLSKLLRDSESKVVVAGLLMLDHNLREEQRLRESENKVLRKIFGAKRDEVTGEWRRLQNAELHALYSSPDIIRNIKSRYLRWARHVAHMSESRNAYRFVSWEAGGKKIFDEVET